VNIFIPATRIDVTNHGQLINSQQTVKFMVSVNVMNSWFSISLTHQQTSVQYSGLPSCIRRATLETPWQPVTMTTPLVPNRRSQSLVCFRRLTTIHNIIAPFSVTVKLPVVTTSPDVAKTFNWDEETKKDKSRTEIVVYVLKLARYLNNSSKYKYPSLLNE